MAVEKRPPPVGYDMKTLRKQIEFLTGELSSKDETESLVYTQNEQLWQYIHELLESNKENAIKMRSYVKKLSVEYEAAAKERDEAEAKVQTVQNATTILNELDRERKLIYLAIEEKERQKLEAKVRHLPNLERKNARTYIISFSLSPTPIATLVSSLPP